MTANSPTVVQQDGRTIIRIPMTFKRRGGRKEIIAANWARGDATARPKAHDPLVTALARAHRWLALLESGRYASITELAHALGVDRSYVSRLLRLAFLAPDLVEAILRGDEPSDLSLRTLARDIPPLWSEQITRFGCPM